MMRKLFVFLFIPSEYFVPVVVDAAENLVGFVPG
jgi:hypothetical protein